MNRYSEIKQVLRRVTNTEQPVYDFLKMEVKQVHEDGDRCTCLMDGMEIPGVRLAAIANGSADRLIVRPAEGSLVEVADLSAGKLRELMVVGYSEVESVTYHHGETRVTVDGEKIEAILGENVILADTDLISVEVGQSTVDITDGKIELNGGDNSGLVKVAQLADKLNSIERDINNLKTALTAWTPVNALETDADALKMAITTWTTSTLNITSKEELQNQKVTH